MFGERTAAVVVSVNLDAYQESATDDSCELLAGRKPPVQYVLSGTSQR